MKADAPHCQFLASPAAMATIGNVISAVPNRPGFDVYCMNPQPFDATPNIVVLTKPASGGDLEARVSFRADYAFRDSRIAANRVRRLDTFSTFS